MSTLLKYAPAITLTAIVKGFWDDKEKRNKGEMVMLVISELGECLEAHRKNQHFDPHDTRVLNLNIEQRDWTNDFKELCKDTVEDELADAVIRILDYVHGWNIPMIIREYRKDSTGNFGHDLLRINWYIINAFHNDTAPEKMAIHDWGYVLAAIEKFAEWYKIDLEQHVQWKMRYNATRPAKHGKAY